MTTLGKASVNIEEIVAGIFGRWTITYVTGKYGIDDGGEILIARRDVCDSGIPQFENPSQPNYVRVYGDVEPELTLNYIPQKHIRPWKSCLSIRVADSSLKPGDKIFIQYGADIEEGSGYQIQTFPESEHIFNIFIDSAGSGNFYNLVNSPVITVSGGYIDQL